MMTVPLVSVIIPAYNAANYLSQAIDSVLNQTYSNIEIIVINDGSIDGETEEIALLYGDKLKYFYQENAGVSSALNRGILNSTGDYVAWLSHDDSFLPNKIEKQIECFRRNPDSHICYTNYNVIDNKSEVHGFIDVPHYENDMFPIRLLQAMFVCGSTVLMRKECFFEKNIFFDETLRYSQDAELWLKLTQHYKYIHLNERLLNWRFHACQGSRNESAMRKDKRAYLTKTIKNVSLNVFFKKDIGIDNFESRAFNRLSSIMLKCHREPKLAFLLLSKSISDWKSIKNIAYINYFSLCFTQFYYYFGLWFSSNIRVYSSKNLNSPKVDFLKASRVVDIDLKQ